MRLRLLGVVWASASLIAGAQTAQTPAGGAAAPIVAIRAGHVVDPESGSVRDNQIIVVENGRITSLGPGPAPNGATVIDLSAAYVLPGLIDAHTHMAMTTIASRDADRLLLASLLEPTASRAIQGVANVRSMLESGFTTVRDLGNAGNFADTALRRGIEEGWIPGPTMIDAGRIIAPYGGQFRLQPEKPDLAEPEYFVADTVDEIRKAVRQNIHYGARVIKLVIDERWYIYSEDDVRAAVKEAGGRLKVAAHVNTDAGALNAVRGGVATVEHIHPVRDETLQLMKERGVYLVPINFPVGSYGGVTTAFYKQSIERLKRAYEIGTPLAFGTDVTYYREGRTRGDLALDHVQSFVDAGIPAAEILRIMTMNASRALGVETRRGALKAGFAADLVAVAVNPLTDLQALREVSFVMKDGVVYKRDGLFAWDTPRKIAR